MIGVISPLRQKRVRRRCSRQLRSVMASAPRQ
jgi:hypothetical protein